MGFPAAVAIEAMKWEDAGLEHFDFKQKVMRLWEPWIRRLNELGVNSPRAVVTVSSTWCSRPQPGRDPREPSRREILLFFHTYR